MPERIKTKSLSIGPEYSADLEFVSTGCTILDKALGGGFPFGKVVNLVGGESSGKTLLALETIIKAMSIYGKELDVYYDDIEDGFSFNTEAMYEVKLELPERSKTVNGFAKNLAAATEKAADSNHKLIYVADSYDELSSEAELERQKEVEEGEELDTSTYGTEKNKDFVRFFRSTWHDLEKDHVLLIIISQIRVKIGGLIFGKKYYRTGSKPLDHNSSQIVWLYESEVFSQTVQGVKVPTGARFRAVIEKNKVGLPFREAHFNAIFDHGLDDITTMIEWIFNLVTETGKTKEKPKTPKKKRGEKTPKKKKELIFQGEDFTRAELVAYVEENNLEEMLIVEAIKKWDFIEDKIRSNRKRKYDF